MSSKVHNIFIVAALASLWTTFAFGDALQNYNYLIDNGKQFVLVKGDNVTIKGNSSQKAVVTKNGELTIGGRPIAVSSNGRQLLIKYAITAFSIDSQAKAALKKMGGNSVALIGDVIGDMITDQDDKKSERKYDASVHASFAPLCDAVSRLRLIQGDIVKSIRQFSPYAVITQEDVDDCNR